MNRMSRFKMGLPNALSIVLMTVTSLPLLFLYVWMVLISFSDGMAGGITPKGFTLQNWSFLWSNFEVNGFKYPNIWHVFWKQLPHCGGHVDH